MTRMSITTRMGSRIAVKIMFVPAAGMNSPGKNLTVASGFHIMKPVSPMMIAPHTNAQYSIFSSKV